AFMACTSMTNARIGNGVTSIEDWTFHGCTRLTNVTIGHSVTNIGEVAFYECGLTSVNIPNSVLTIGRRAFFQSGLTNLNIGNSVTSIGEGAFCGCTNLITATIGNSVTNIGDYAFALGTTNLAGVYFKGNAPSLGLCVFQFESLCHPTAYYLPGTTGWDTTFGGLSTALWNPQAPTTDPTFGVRANQFGFTVTGTSNLVIVVEACTNLTKPDWTPVGTNTLTGGSSFFSDPQWTNYPARFYRFRSP
ncbi:MAG: leucine-rich repeat domain-containing protein, partial [Verrucomicrobia bacterium]|nr:leucine-rich repeat domain-containing protein [Verrucomicrobiota bacterium]